MPIGKIRSDELTLADQRSNYPALSNKSYFNYGGQGVLARAALEEIQTSYEFVQREGPFSTRMFGWIDDELNMTKKALASELGGEPDCYAITQNATEGCNIAMWGIEWQEGDHLIITDCEHPGVEAVAKQVAARRKLELTYVKLSDFTSAADEIEAAFKPRTRMVALSQVLWNTGRALPIVEIQNRCRKANIKLLVDAAQSAGVVPIDLKELDVDLFAFTGHKWLCGPEGVGALYVHPNMLEELKPTFMGWRSCMLGDGKPTAAQFEVATCPFPLLAGLRAAIKVHQEWGSSKDRFEQVQNNVRELRHRLSEIENINIITPANERSGLVSFAVAGKKQFDVLKTLDSHRVFLRTIPGLDCLRASVHYLTNESDIQSLLDVLRSP